MRPPGTIESLHEHNERARVPRLLERLQSGARVALVSDAGTPLVSDPGAALVAAAWAAGARVVPVPGPSAALAALVASGLAADRFLVAGLLPRKGPARAQALRWMAAVPATLVIYEAGNRTAATLRDLAESFGDRPAALAREMTKLHEEMARGRLLDLAARFSGEVRGEVTLVVAGAEVGAPLEPPPVEDLDDELRTRLAAGEAPSEIARTVARARGLPRRDVYARLQELKAGTRGA